MIGGLTWMVAVVALALPGEPAPQPPPTLLVVGVDATDLSPAIRSAWTERLMRGLGKEGFRVRGPGDSARALGAQKHSQLLACLSEGTCQPDTLAATGVDALLVVLLDEKGAARVKAVTSGGKPAVDLHLSKGSLRIAEELETSAPQMTVSLLHALQRTSNPRPIPWTLVGHWTLGTGVALSLLGTVSFVDSVRRANQLRNESPETLFPSQALESARIGRAELVLGTLALVASAGTFFLASHFYRLGDPSIAPSSLSLTWSLGPGGLVVGGAW